MTSTIRQAISTIDTGLRRAAKPINGERGIAVPLVAVYLMALVGLAAVGVDTGRVATVATEAQNAADVAALAGARGLADSDDPASRAEQVLDQNKIDGALATPALKSIEIGNLDANYIFTPNLAPTNAVRATVSDTMNTIMLGAIGYPTSTVTREAIALLSGIGSVVPSLPIVIGECNFNTTCFEDDCMPSFTQMPNTANNSAWTGYFGGVSNSWISSLMPPPAGAGNTTVINVGDVINLHNGSGQQFLNGVNQLLGDGQTKFVVPIVDCTGSASQSKEVRGFASIEILFVKTTGNPRGIWLRTLYEATIGTPGGGNFGLQTVTLAR